MRMIPKPTADVMKLSNTELVDLLKFYNLYAVSTGGARSPLVIDGKSMLEEIKRRLLKDEPEPPTPPVSIHPETPNKLDII